MRRVRWVVPVLVLVAACSGCGADTERSRAEREAEDKAASNDAESRSPDASPTASPSGFDPARLVTVAAAKPWGTGPDEFARSGDGATLVVLARGSVREWTRFRIYGRDWRPITGLREASLELVNVRGLPHGFVAEASYRLDRQGMRLAHTWVHIDRSGRMTKVPRSTEAGPIADDEIVVTPSSGGAAVVDRRATYVRRPTLPRNAPPRQQWQLWDEGRNSCISRGRGARTTLKWSFDSGRTWTQASLGRVTPAGVVRGALACAPAGADRLLVTEGDQLVELAHLSTLQVSTGANKTAKDHLALVGRHPLDGQGPIWMGAILPDGRAVLQDEGGVQVAVDASNSDFEFRPGPVKKEDMLMVHGRDLISSSGFPRMFELAISADAGQTWRVVNLKAGSWN